MPTLNIDVLSPTVVLLLVSMILGATLALILNSYIPWLIAVGMLRILKTGAEECRER